MKDDGVRVVYEDSDYQARIDWEGMRKSNDRRVSERKEQIARERERDRQRAQSAPEPK